MESAHGGMEMMKSRTEATVNQLTDEKRLCDDKIRDLEGRLRYTKYSAYSQIKK